MTNLTTKQTDKTVKAKERINKKNCKHEPEIITVTNRGDGYAHQYHVNGHVCIKCGELL